MREIFAALQSRFAPSHGFNEAVFFREVPGHYILYNFVQLDALLVRSLREPGLQVGSELDFHGLKIQQKMKLNRLERTRSTVPAASCRCARR